MFDDRFVRRQRFSALLNGVMIGFGVVLLFGGPLGLLPLGAGLLVEMWQQRRLPR